MTYQLSKEIPFVTVVILFYSYLLEKDVHNIPEYIRSKVKVLIY